MKHWAETAVAATMLASYGIVIRFASVRLERPHTRGKALDFFLKLALIPVILIGVPVVVIPVFSAIYWICGGQF